MHPLFDLPCLGPLPFWIQKAMGLAGQSHFSPFCLGGNHWSIMDHQRWSHSRGFSRWVRNTWLEKWMISALPTVIWRHMASNRQHFPLWATLYLSLLHLPPLLTYQNGICLLAMQQALNCGSISLTLSLRVKKPSMLLTWVCLMESVKAFDYPARNIPVKQAFGFEV